MPKLKNGVSHRFAIRFWDTEDLRYRYEYVVSRNRITAAKTLLTNHPEAKEIDVMPGTKPIVLALSLGRMSWPPMVLV